MCHTLRMTLKELSKNLVDSTHSATNATLEGFSTRSDPN